MPCGGRCCHHPSLTHEGTEALEAKELVKVSLLKVESGFEPRHCDSVTLILLPGFTGCFHAIVRNGAIKNAVAYAQVSMSTSSVPAAGFPRGDETHHQFCLQLS